MMLTLGQTMVPVSDSLSAPIVAPDPVTNLFETVVGLFSRVDMLAQPDQLVHHLQMLSVVWAVVFVVVGVLCLLGGAKHYKAVVVGLALLIGMFAGYWLGQKIDSPYIVAGCLGLLLAVLAFPLMKYAVAVCGGLAGAFVGANLWTGLSHALNKGADLHMATDAAWIGALIGLVVCGMLAFILFEFSVAMFTSVSGATIAVLGVLCLLLSIQPWQPSVIEGLTASQLVVPLLVFVPAIVGLVLQQSWAGGEEAAD